MKRFLWILLLALALPAGAQRGKVYFDAGAMPDLVKCLPAPPQPGSDAYAYDVRRYEWGKQMRKDSLRAAVAMADACWKLEEVFACFDEAFGIPISHATTPATFELLTDAISTIEQIRVQPKAYFARKRPFVVYGEPMLSRWEEEGLAGEGSYPSGHSIRGWAVAMLLCEINPDAADALIRRGFDYGESRVIVGAHWQSDVDVSRLAACIGLTWIQSSPRYQCQLRRARREYRRLSRKG